MSAEATTEPSLFRSVLEIERADAASVNLAQTLENIRKFLCRFIAFSSNDQPLCIALWIAHTWVVDCFDYTPYLHIESPEKRCGKSLLLDCLTLLVAKPWQVVSPSEAVLFRKIQADGPTLLLDEVDTIFSGRKDDGKEPLRALLNAGFERRAKIPRCVGPQHDLHEFQVFCPKAIAGIGKLPDTISDRCLPIRLVRRAPTERVERFRRREVEADSAPLRDALAQWAESEIARPALCEARPTIPEQLGDRQADICEPLLAIADLASGDWPRCSRRALENLCTGETDDDDSIGVKLLRAIRTLFHSAGADRMPTKEILDGLISAEDDGPWAHWWEHDMASDNTRGPAARLARLLKPYRIKVRTIRLDESTPKGYHAKDFEEAWERYCPPIPA